ncbi:hypothetical protein DL546_006797 [Coniochaeta pulveracea]|nr:hypothetical protein DL546_006797 [Coniochaeta pulveracea]
MLEPTCKNCKKASSIDKPLRRCSNCRRYYHSTCHRPTPPFPFPKTGWTCSSSRCKPARTVFEWKSIALYHGSKTSPSNSNSTKSSASSRPISRAGEMAAGPGASFTPDSIHGADDRPLEKCAIPNCLSRSSDSSRFCTRHAIGPPERQAATKMGQAHGVPYRPPNTTLSPEHVPGSVLPVTRRKTGTTATPGPFFGERSSSGSAPQKSPVDVTAKARSLEKKKAPNGASVPRAATSVSEETKMVSEPQQGLPQQRLPNQRPPQQGVPPQKLPQQRGPPPIFKPLQPRQSLEEQLFPEVLAKTQKRPPPRENPPWHKLFLSSPPNNPKPVGPISAKRPYSPPIPGTVSEQEFDSLIYSQQGAASPPPGVVIQPVIQPPPPPEPPKESKDGPFFMHIDPRLHWPQPHSRAWYERKLEEIKARGGRKANFGKAVERIKARGPVSFEDTLPQRVRDDPKWVRALKSLEEQGQETEKEKRAPINGSRGAQKEKPAVLKRHASAPNASSTRQT